MGFSRGPKIVTDGLVFALDAGSKKSYPGSGDVITDLTSRLGGNMLNGASFSNEAGGTFSFDGSNDYISTSAFDMGTPSDITLECFIRFNGTLDSNDRKVMHYDKTGTTNAVFQLRKGDNNGRLKYQHHDGSTWHTLNLDSAIESDTWTHIVVTQISNNAIMYKNGVSSASSGMGYLDWTNANNLLIGYRAAAEYWKGDIPLMKIYNRALTAQEVLQNYNAQKSRFI
jgi:hypothetical protein